LSIGEGANYEAQQEIKKLGSENIILKSKKPSEEEGSGYERTELSTYGLTWEDFRRISDTLPRAKLLVPMRIILGDGRSRQQTTDVPVVGTAPSYLSVGNTRLSRGRFISQSDLDTLRPVCVLGSAVARSLFATVDPLGNDVKLGPLYFHIIGIMEPTGA